MTITKHFAQVCALSVALVSVTVNARAEPPTLDGVYTLDVKASDDMEKVIKAYIANASFVVRSFARGQFKVRHPAYKQVQITHNATEVVVTFDASNPMHLPMDGKTAQWKREDGQMLDMKGQWQSNHLIQVITHDAWKRTNEFHLSADGATLTLNVDFFQQGGVSDKPMLYRLVYRRSGTETRIKTTLTLPSATAAGVTLPPASVQSPPVTGRG